MGKRIKAYMIITFLVISCLFFSVSATSISALAASNTTESTCVVKASDVVTTAGTDFSMEILIENNPGISSAEILISWDEHLTLTDAVLGDAFSALSYTPPSYYRNPIVFMWDSEKINDEDIKDGVLLTLTFHVEDTTSDGDLPVYVSYQYGDIYDRNSEPVEIETINGTVTVVSYMPGDVNGDGRINTLDITNIRRYISDGRKTDPNGYNITINEAAADVNADGRINTLDITNIRRYISDGRTTDPNGYNIVLKPSKPICTHTLEAVSYKAPTCTEDGNEAYWKCTKCGKYYSDDAAKYEITLASTVIGATGHTYAAEWSSNETYHWHAATCGHTNEVSDKAEHSFGTDNKCSVCGAQAPNSGKLNTPQNIDVKSDIIYWDSVENADSYTIRVNDVKGLTYEYVAKNESTACALPEVKRDGNPIPADMEHCGIVSVKVKANANGKYEESDWSETNSSYFYIPSSPIGQEINNLYLGFGYNLNEWEYLNINPGEHSMYNVLNPGKLLTISQGISNPTITLGEGVSFYYENIDEYIKKTATSIGASAGFEDKSGKLLGLFIKGGGSQSNTYDFSTYDKNITLVCESYKTNTAYEFSSLNLDLLRYCLSETFQNDIQKRENETDDEYCGRLYEKYGTIAMLGVVTGGKYGLKYTVSTNKESVAESVRNSFSLSVGANLEKLFNANFNLETSVQNDISSGSTETRANVFSYYFGGEGTTATTVSGIESALQSWSVNGSTARPIALTNNGAIAICSLISSVDERLGKLYEEYVNERLNDLCAELYSKYVKPSELPINLENDGTLKINLSAYEGSDLDGVVCSYLNGNILTIYPTYCGKEIKKIVVEGTFDQTRECVDGLVIALSGWLRDVDIEFHNVGIKCASRYGAVDASQLSSNVKVNITYDGINLLEQTSGLTEMIADNKTYYLDYDKDTEIIQYASVNSILPVVIEANKQFLGWQDINGNMVTDNQGDFLQSYSLVDQSLTVHPVMEGIRYTITLDHQGADNSQSLVENFYEKWEDAFYGDFECTQKITQITIPTRIGYRFGGYYLKVMNNATNQAFGADQIVGADGQISAGSTKFCSQETVFALWIPEIYSVTLSAPEANNIYSSTIYEQYGCGFFTDTACEHTISEMILPTRNGWRFDGFYSGDTCVIDAEGNFSIGNKAITNSTTILTAKWSQVDFNVELDTNGGTINSGNITSYTFGQETYLPTNVTQIGYSFKGWYTQEENDNGTGTQVTKIASSQTGDVKYYAKWEQDSYSVTLDAKGGTINSGNVTKYSYGDVIILPTDVTRTGYRFDGWYTSAGTKLTYFGPNQVGDMYLEAHWEAIIYTMTFNSNGGSEVSAIQAKYGDSITAPTSPTKDGYAFIGWDNTIPSTMPAENLSFTANWLMIKDVIKIKDGGVASSYNDYVYEENYDIDYSETYSTKLDIAGLIANGFNSVKVSINFDAQVKGGLALMRVTSSTVELCKWENDGSGTCSATNTIPIDDLLYSNYFIVYSSIVRIYSSYGAGSASMTFTNATVTFEAIK